MRVLGKYNGSNRNKEVYNDAKELLVEYNEYK
jgi:hypothetical protein